MEIVSDLPPGPGSDPGEIDEMRSFFSLVRDMVPAIHEAIREDYRADLNRSRSELEMMQGQIMGELSSSLSAAMQLLNKCYGKIQKDLRGSVDSAYGKAYLAGLPYCSVEQMLYGLETGDYLAAMGLSEGPFLTASTEATPEENYSSPEEIETEPELDNDGWPIGTIAIDESVPPPEGYKPITLTQDREIIYVPEKVYDRVDPGIINIQFGGPATTIFDMDVKQFLDGKSQGEKEKEEEEEYKKPPPPPGEIPIPRIPSMKELFPIPPTPTPPREKPPEFVPEESDLELVYRWFGKQFENPERQRKMANIQETVKLLVNFNWDSPEVCSNLEQIKNRMAESFDVVFDWILSEINAIFGQFERAVRQEERRGTVTQFLDDQGLGLLSKGVNLLSDSSAIPIAITRYAVDSILSLFRWGATGLYGTLSTSTGDFTAIAPSWLLKAILDFISRWLGVDFFWITRPLELYMRYVFPTEMPSLADAQRLYLAGKIDRGTLNCLARLNGFYPNWQEEVTKTFRAKPNVNEVVQLRLRKFLDDPTYLKLMREEGVLDDNDRKRFEQLAIAQPGISDIITFLVRDVADNELVEKFGMDADFEKKWQGLLIQYAEALGIPPELAKYYWRAHWHIPSPTQLFEMIHRLRPGAVDEKLAVTHETVREALQQDDVLPFWIDKLLAVSYRPITRTDAQRAYEIGAFTEAELEAAYLDEGYNPKDAKLLVRFSTQLVQTRRRRKIGIPSGRELMNRYVAGNLSVEDLKTQLRELKFTEQEIDESVKWSGRKIRNDNNKARIKCVKDRYMKGMLTRNESVIEVEKVTEDNLHAQQIVDGWCRILSQKEKEVPAGQLCEMFQRNLITQRTFEVALVNLGYSIDRARAIVALCVQEGQEEKEKATKRALEDARRARERAEKAAEKAEKKRKEQEKEEAKKKKE